MISRMFRRNSATAPKSPEPQKTEEDVKGEKPESSPSNRSPPSTPLTPPSKSPLSYRSPKRSASRNSREGDCPETVALAYSAVVRESSSASLDISVDLNAAKSGAEDQVEAQIVAEPVIIEPTNAEREAALAKSAKACEFLLDPSVATFLQWREIGRLHTISGTARGFAEDLAVAPGLWMAACISLGTEAALYVPELPPSLYVDGGAQPIAAAKGLNQTEASEATSAVIGSGRHGAGGPNGAAQGGMAWKRYFFDSLWPARSKWGIDPLAAAEDEPPAVGAQDFKINVCVRFRPLEEPPPDSKLGLPLHQFIKLQRQQAKEKARAAGKDSSGKQKISVGTAPPERFLDGVFGTLMKDPVQLPSSGVIMDRSGALQAIKHRKKDPMDNTKLLHANRLIELPELKSEIEAWRAARDESDHELDRVKRSVIVRDLVDGDGNEGLPPEVLEALLEAERLEAFMKGADDASALDSKLKRRDRGEDPDGADEPLEGDEGNVDEDEEVDEGGGADSAGGTRHSAATLTVGLESAEKEAAAQEKEAGGDDNGGPFPPGSGAGRLQRDGPRLLGLHPSRVVMYVPGMGVRPFPFSRVFSGSTTQATCYDQCARQAICAALNGWNACILAYGQTGSGKTHSAFGPPGALDGSTDMSDESGIVVRAIDELLRGANALAQNAWSSSSSSSSLAAKDSLNENFAESGVTVRLSCNYVEIYNDDVTCLLTGEKCDVRRSARDGAPSLTNAAECPITDLGEALRLLRAGQVRKRFAATAMNARSSRAHTVLVLHVRLARGDAVVKSTLHLVDLAGSERLKKSKAEGSRKVEAVGINESLMVLGKVIAALVESRHHVPYFECKLTTLLRGALGGASRTTALVCCRGDDAQAEETLQALRFGERCSLVSNVNKLMTASSATDALSSIDATLKNCEASAASLRARGKEHLPAFKALVDRIQQLSQRRRAIADVARAEERNKGKGSVLPAPIKQDN